MNSIYTFIKKYYIFLIIIFFIFLLNLNIDENISFYGDNSTKYFQAYSVIENHFKDDIIRCIWLKDFEFCKFHIVTNTLYFSKENTIMGVFPIALSYVNGFIINFLGNAFFLWFPQFVFILTLWILYKYAGLHSIYIWIIFFCTPLFLQFMTFSDVAYSIFFIGFFYIYHSIIDRLTLIKIIIIGIIIGVNIFFRYESEIFIGIMVMLLFILDGKNRKKHIILGVGIGLSLFIFFIVNYLFYNNILGNRLHSNMTSIFNWDIYQKLISIWGNVWGISLHPVGYFKFMPYMLYFFLIYLWNIKKIEIKDKIYFLSIIVSMIIILILTPNDSNVDFGTRYLSVLILPSLVLIDNYFKYNKSKIMKILLFLLIVPSLYYNINFLKNIIKLNQQGQILYNSIEKEYRRNSIWIFFSNFWPNIFGTYIYNNKVLVIENEEELKHFIQLFEERHLNEKYKNVILYDLDTRISLGEEIHLRDRYFYEDKKVKNVIIEYFKKNSIQCNNKEIIFDKNTIVKINECKLK